MFRSLSFHSLVDADLYHLNICFIIVKERTVIQNAMQSSKSQKKMFTFRVY